MDSELRNIIFISEIKPLTDNATSTHMMTANLLKGLRENHCSVFFIAVCEDEKQREEIERAFEPLVARILVVKSFYGASLNKYQRMWEMLKSCGGIGKYRRELDRGITGEKEYSLVLTHCPSFEAIPYCRALKEYYPDIPVYEYWSDPIALSGITPEAYNFKRWIFHFIERKGLKYADKIIYGTKTLMDMQKKLYPKEAQKMSYVDICYGEKEEAATNEYNDNFLYAGGYYSNIRNILPLCEAINDNGDLALDIYGGGNVELDGYRGVKAHGRVSPNQMKEIEKRYKNVVCILNHSCVQIPGKLFYDMYSDKNILVVTDGTYGAEIGEYLNKYKRFYFCENDKEAIASELRKMKRAERFSEKQYIEEHFSPQMIARDLINGGLN